MSEFTPYVDLASERLGGRAVAVSDDFFAPKENLLKRAPPVWVPDKYTDRGKWMDGWESRRRRTPGHDWCVVQLGVPGIIRSLVVDTAFFKGNFPSHCSLDGCAADPAEVETSPDAVEWTRVLAKSELRGDALNVFAVDKTRRFSHVRLNIYPDGGVARLRVLGEAVPDWRRVLADGAELDLASLRNGALVLDTSDRFFGEPQNMLMPDRAANMGDGWETKRRRGPGHDWSIVRLGLEGIVHRIELDTAHFKGNYPDSCSVDAAAARDSRLGGRMPAELDWRPLLPQTKLQPDHLHVFSTELTPEIPATHLRLSIYPDGGISRFRAWGQPTAAGRRRARLMLLNTLSDLEARAALQDCCAAPTWIAGMVASRPFATPEALYAAAEALLHQLTREDWLEAIRHHPRIGEQRAEREGSPTARAWSTTEQAGVRQGTAESLAALAALNREYEERFGYVFIVCASGRTLEEMTKLLRQRLTNSPEQELDVAAGELRRITRLRLEKLLT